MSHLSPKFEVIVDFTDATNEELEEMFPPTTSKEKVEPPVAEKETYQVDETGQTDDYYYTRNIKEWGNTIH